MLSRLNLIQNFRNLNGIAGRSGWRWLYVFQQLRSPTMNYLSINTKKHRFIIDGIITMPIALYGFLVFPDVPATTKAFYLSKDVGLFSVCIVTDV